MAAYHLRKSGQGTSRLRAGFDRLNQGRPAERLESFVRMKDGHRVKTSMTLSPVRDDLGALLGASFVVDEVGGVWGTASEVAGSLNTGGNAWINSVSCSSDGNCAAGGYYKDGSGNIQAFVFDEVYTVTFNVNGGSVTMSAESYTTGVAKVLTANAFTFTGYTFTGWNTAANGSGTAYTDGQIITISADVSLCAQWIAKPLPKEILKAHPSNAPFGGQVHLRIHLFGKMGTVSGRVEVSFAGKTICSAALVDGVAVCSL